MRCFTPTKVAKKYDTHYSRTYQRRGDSCLRANPQEQNRRSVCRRPRTSISDFRKGRLLAEGRFGKVFVVKHARTGAVFAVKAMQKKMILEESYSTQLARQIFCQSRVDSPYVVKLYAFFDDKDYVYLLLELALGLNLAMALKVEGIERPPEGLARATLRMVAQGLSHCHAAGVVHRDVKPQNVVLALGMAKLCDFGWSIPNRPGLTGFCGTIDYLAPEIVSEQSYSQKVDIWSLGVLAYELLAGFLPFYAQDQQATLQNIVAGRVLDWDELSEAGQSLVSRLLRKEPYDRPSAAQLLEDTFLSQRL